MNCPKCGSPVGKNDEYCGSCGYHLNTSGEEKPKKKKSGLMIFTIFLEVIAIVVIVGAIFFVVHGDKETKKDGGIQTEADLNSSEKKEKTDSSSNEGEDGKSDSSSNAVEQEGSDGTSDTENHAEPAPDGTANQDAGAEVEKITSAELLEDSDLLKSVKKTYTRIGIGALLSPVPVFRDLERGNSELTTAHPLPELARYYQQIDYVQYDPSESEEGLMKLVAKVFTRHGYDLLSAIQRLEEDTTHQLSIFQNAFDARAALSISEHITAPVQAKLPILRELLERESN